MNRDKNNDSFEAILLLLGSRIKGLRLKAGWTQENLAEKAGINDKEVSHIEAGRRNITIETLVKIATALNVPAHELIEPRLAI